jgi:hypothetical protein
MEMGKGSMQEKRKAIELFYFYSNTLNQQLAVKRKTKQK